MVLAVYFVERMLSASTVASNAACTAWTFGSVSIASRAARIRSFSFALRSSAGVGRAGAPLTIVSLTRGRSARFSAPSSRARSCCVFRCSLSGGKTSCKAPAVCDCRAQWSASCRARPAQIQRLQQRRPIDRRDSSPAGRLGAAVAQPLEPTRRGRRLPVRAQPHRLRRRRQAQERAPPARPRRARRGRAGPRRIRLGPPAGTRACAAASSRTPCADRG